MYPDGQWIKYLQCNINLYFMQSFILINILETEVLFRAYMKHGFTKHCLT